MKKKALQLAFILIIVSNNLFAQWAGSTTTSGDIYRDGNVGIGTTSPRALLSLGAGNGGKRLLVYDNYITNVQAGFGIDMSNTGGRELTIFHPTSNGIDGRVSFGRILESTGAYTETMRITGGGNVGIGTINTGSFKLAVEGKIGAREIQVTLTNPFPDYVFAPNYKLPSLASLEQYIIKYKHLPNVPSAEEVEKNGGVELGKLSTQLLEKVEELTLYVIELKKENEQMKKEIEKLSKKK